MSRAMSSGSSTCITRRWECEQRRPAVAVALTPCVAVLAWLGGLGQIDIVFKRFLPMLQELYAAYSGRFRKPGEAAYMSVQEWIDMCKAARIVNEESGITDRDPRIAFVSAMMTVVNEIKTDRHKRMTFVEFLEGVRAAHLRLGARASSDTRAPAWRVTGGATGCMRQAPWSHVAEAGGAVDAAPGATQDARGPVARFHRQRRSRGRHPGHAVR